MDWESESESSSDVDSEIKMEIEKAISAFFPGGTACPVCSTARKGFFGEPSDKPEDSPNPPQEFISIKKPFQIYDDRQGIRAHAKRISTSCQIQIGCSCVP